MVFHRWLAAAALLLASTGAARAQGGPFAKPWEIELRHIQHAMTALDFEIEQVRRVVDLRGGSPVVTGILEQLRHGRDRGEGERFDLAFRGIEGVQLTESQFAQRDQLFRSQAGAIHLDQSFRIVDLADANANYALFYISLVQRAQRHCYRVLLLPRLVARSAWVLDLDLETGYPLYRGEINALGEFAGEIEVSSFRHGAAARLPENDWGWKSPPNVTEYTDPAAAVRALGSQYVLPETAVLPPGYEPVAARVVQDPLSPARRLVIDFCDGIDQIHVVEAATGELPFVEAGHTVSVYRDAGMSLAHFRHGGLDCTVIGSGADAVVRYVSESFYRQLLR
jgi:hypothetical protein